MEKRVKLTLGDGTDFIFTRLFASIISLDMVFDFDTSVNLHREDVNLVQKQD